MDIEDERKILRPQFGDAKLVVDHTERFCSHDYISLLRYSETVVCRVCNAEVQAFDVLLKMATDWQCATWRREEIDTLNRKIAELKREESNIKSRLRSAHKLGVPETRSKVYFDEFIRLLSEACTWDAVRSAFHWAAEFRWLEPDQYKAIADAKFAAEQRAEATARHRPRNKREVRVIDGGKPRSANEKNQPTGDSNK